MLRFALLTCCLSLLARADPKLAYVDMQRALWEVEEGKAAKARVQALADAAKKRVEPERLALMKEKDDFEKQATKLSPSVRSQRGSELEKKMLEFNEKLQKAGEEVDAQQRREVDAIISKIQAIVASLAERESLMMIFDKGRSGLVYAPTSLDYTNEVIRTYNAQYAKPGEPAKPTSSPAPKKNVSKKP